MPNALPPLLIQAEENLMLAKHSNMIPLLEAKILLAVALVLAPASTLKCAAMPEEDDEQLTTQQHPITLDGCPEKCGDVSIPYPFGTKAGCFLLGFEVVCNGTFNPPRPFIANPTLDSTTGPVLSIDDNKCSSSPTACRETSKSPVELIEMSTDKGQARVYAAFSFACDTSTTRGWTREQQLDTPESSPFVISKASNVRVGIGRGVQAQIDGASAHDTGSRSYKASCMSRGTPAAAVHADDSCDAAGCCRAADMPWSLQRSHVKTTNLQTTAGYCSYGMLVERSWYNFSVADLDDDVFLRKNPRGFPVVLDFAVRTTGGWCPAAGRPVPQGDACVGGNSSCANAPDGRPGYVCKCRDGFDGNPYIPSGCQDIDECAIRKQNLELQQIYPCATGGTCVNRVGSYDCPCMGWMKGDGKTGPCTEKFPLPAKVAVGVIGGSLAAVVTMLVVLLVLEKQKTRKFFMKNGGSIIMKHINNIKIFKKKELKKITKNYSDVLGHGAFGNVYKGSLDYRREVAVKRSIKINEGQKEQFANELIEVDVPMLVYEFVSKGNLHDTLHGCHKVHLSLDERLVIAIESADGLAYMHFKTPTIILHGDVKPSNILLDNNLFPKISDFGISRLIAKDKALYTDNVIGDLSYVDPQYLKTGLLTRKSDVYSFGVVLLELITRNQATQGGSSGLVESFRTIYTRENGLNGMFDQEISEDNEIKVLHNIAELAIECLNDNVEQRPDMMEIAKRLQNIRREINN